MSGARHDDSPPEVEIHQSGPQHHHRRQQGELQLPEVRDPAGAGDLPLSAGGGGPARDCPPGGSRPGRMVSRSQSQSVEAMILTFPSLFYIFCTEKQ